MEMKFKTFFFGKNLAFTVFVHGPQEVGIYRRRNISRIIPGNVISRNNQWLTCEANDPAECVVMCV